MESLEGVSGEKSRSRRCTYAFPLSGGEKRWNNIFGVLVRKRWAAWLPPREPKGIPHADLDQGNMPFSTGEWLVRICSGSADKGSVDQTAYPEELEELL